MSASTAWDAPVKDLAVFAPFKRPDGRIITSTVVNETKEWYQESYLVPHEPIRRDLIEVEDLLNNHVKEDEAWKLINFFNWYEKRFQVIVHHHHDGEEDIFFPEFIKRLKTFPPNAAEEHKSLLKLLDEIETIGKEFRAAGAEPSKEVCAKTLTALKAKWAVLKSEMLPHLADEEQVMLTQLKDVFTPEEYGKLVTSVIRHGGLRGGRLMLPTIIESLEMWGSEENKAKFYGGLPPPIRFLAWAFWIPAFNSYHRGALQSMRTGAPKKIIRDWF